jgi:hypothetical protein
MRDNEVGHMVKTLNMHDCRLKAIGSVQRLTKPADLCCEVIINDSAYFDCRSTIREKRQRPSEDSFILFSGPILILVRLKRYDIRKTCWICNGAPDNSDVQEGSRSQIRFTNQQSRSTTRRRGLKAFFTHVIIAYVSAASDGFGTTS